MTIDWSKAPEGTTHWLPENKHLRESWIKIEGGSYWFRMPDATCWVRYDAPVIWLSDIIAKPANAISPWTGEGLPPVGTVCEYGQGQEWQQVTVIAHWLNGSDLCPVAQVPNNGPICMGELKYFRPIRTAEQIEQQEIQKIRDELGWKRPQLGACPVEQMYLLGYRKQEQK